MTMCFACRVRPAGNKRAGAASAYCASCQPVSIRRIPRGGQSACAACVCLFATLADFDAHQVRRGGVFTGECLDPSSVGLELSAGAWGTREGNANRVRITARLPRRSPANLAA
jgi:hypothetical protein